MEQSSKRNEAEFQGNILSHVINKPMVGDTSLNTTVTHDFNGELVDYRQILAQTSLSCLSGKHFIFLPAKVRKRGFLIEEEAKEKNDAHQNLSSVFSQRLT